MPGNLADLAALHAAGVFGFKCFLIDSGVPEFGHLETERVRGGDGRGGPARRADARPRRGPRAGRRGPRGRARRTPASWPRGHRARRSRRSAAWPSRRCAPVRAPTCCTSAAPTRCPVVRRARAAGADLSVETCPHYLVFDAEEVPDGATEFKCCPPDPRRRQPGASCGPRWPPATSTSSSPTTRRARRSSSGAAAATSGRPGAASPPSRSSLPAVWTAARTRGHDLADVVRWMATGPADRVGLAHKGRIEAAPTPTWWSSRRTRSSSSTRRPLAHRHPVSAYAGRRLSGVVRRTWLRGEPVTPDRAPHGRFLRRGRR